MPLNKICIFVLILLLFEDSHSHRMIDYSTADVLLPYKLRPYMFKTTITGQIDIMIPFKQSMNLKGKKVQEEYEIQMIKTKQQFLPAELYNATTIYAYGGQTTAGYKASFPGPAIFATKDRPIKVTWKNNIPGPHILPVDYSYPFKNNSAFVNEVPTIPHAHGIASMTSSDGQPEAYWTKSGAKSAGYNTEQPCAANEAVFVYPNQQEASNNWYHDHTIGITRLNVYAGLVGFYKILDPQSKQEAQIVAKHGPSVSQNQTKYLIVTDKTFKNNGELFYPADTTNPSFTSWIPQFYGNTMLVNGVIWPLMNLKKTKHRFVLLNACQNRFLNIYFDHLGKVVPIQLIRIDGDYFDNQVIVTEYFTSIASRIEFIIDLANIQGQVILKNTAPAPFPQGDSANLVPEFTGQIMKIMVQGSQIQSINQEGLKIDFSLKRKEKIKVSKFPFFQEGQKVFTTLFEVPTLDDDVDAMFIDGISMMNGMDCANSTYKIGKTYDFYIINLTPDTHPIHFHLINMQKVKQFEFDVQEYSAKYFQLNGGRPGKHGFESPAISLDPQEFRISDDELPKQYEKVFRDTIQTNPGYVTVFRIKFAKNDGSNFQSIDIKNQRYVFHCHMLEHEDNQMMKYFCLE